jgi:hypothetical protein
MKSLALISALSVSLLNACAASSEDVASSDADLSSAQPADSVTDFLSGGEFGCAARDASGREADISMSVGTPRKHRETWLADGDYQVMFGGEGRVTYTAQNRGRPVGTVKAGPLTIRFGFGRVMCQYDRVTTGPDGQSFTRRFEGPVVRFVPAGECFNESFYLREYADIGTAVQSGNWLSGRMHWEEYGRREGRRGCATP